jgi:hypothetical protein
LLKILFSKVGVDWPHDAKQSIDNGSYAVEMAGPKDAFKSSPVSTSAKRFDFLRIGDLGEKLPKTADKGHGASLVLERGEVSLKVSGISVVIFRVLELQRVYKDADATGLIFAAGALDQG